MATNSGRLQRKTTKGQHPSMSINAATAAEKRGAPPQRWRRAVVKAAKMHGTRRSPGNYDVPRVTRDGQSIAAIGVQRFVRHHAPPVRKSTEMRAASRRATARNDSTANLSNNGRAVTECYRPRAGDHRTVKTSHGIKCRSHETKVPVAASKRSLRAKEVSDSSD